jgi:hypothetical protein
MNNSEADRKQRLFEIVQRSTWLMEALMTVRQLGLAEWCIAAGAVRGLVWDVLHKHEVSSVLPDVDVVYFDCSDISQQRDLALQRKLSSVCPNVPWEVTNQAGVHQWLESEFGGTHAPFRSLQEGIASWPEFATAVGIFLDDDDLLRVVAPHGLNDLFAMRVRRNAASVGAEIYHQRIAEKRWSERWPLLEVVPC